MCDDIDFGWLEDIVRAAGEIALQHFRRVTTSRKADNTVVTVADCQVETFLRDALSQAFPADGLLGEEWGVRQGHTGRVWAIDPIDGTAAYAAGLPVWGVSVGLLRDWMPIAGIFYLPLLDELYISHGQDALFNGQSIHVDDSHHIDDESFLSVTSAAHRKYRINFAGKTRALGSTAANICYVARGTAVAALIGRPSLWDIAGVLPILRAAGGELRYLSGHSLDLAMLADGRKCPYPVLAGAPWALDYFSARIELLQG
ncbi:MAG: inositol monophosphatase family protein [Anaerolineae bacterium]